MTETERHAIVATIPSDASRAAIKTFLHLNERRKRAAMLKAARDAMREAVRRTDAWNEADGIRREINKATQESRKEIAGHQLAARNDPAVKQIAAEVERLKEQVKQLDGMLAGDLDDNEQMMLPFAREVGA